VIQAGQNNAGAGGNPLRRNPGNHAVGAKTFADTGPVTGMTCRQHTSTRTVAAVVDLLAAVVVAASLQPVAVSSPVVFPLATGQSQHKMELLELAANFALASYFG
jgi:hypothetical protein